MKEQFLNIPGPVGQLESALLMPEGKTEQFAIICHPHPEHEGSMDNKVVTTLARAFRDLGISTIRFNFRGVGQSEGSYGNAIGEVDDVKAIRAFVLQKYNPKTILMAGFSFGAYIAWQASVDDNPDYLLTVAPAILNEPYKTDENPNCPWLIIQPETDEVVDVKATYDFAKSVEDKADLMTVPDASHFFHGKLVELKNIVTNHLKEHLQIDRENE